MMKPTRTMHTRYLLFLCHGSADFHGVVLVQQLLALGAVKLGHQGTVVQHA